MRQRYLYTTPNGILMWDVTSILESINAHPEAYPISYIKTADLAKNNPANISHTRAMMTNIEEPIVVAALTEQHYVLIDGNHRLFKASSLGIDQLPCYFLTKEQHQRFIDHFRPAEYEKIVAGC